jgi:uncharacterized protein
MGLEPATATMQLTREQTDANLVRAFEGDAIRVNEEWIQGHLILASDRIIRNWPAPHPNSLGLVDLEPAVALEPQIILLGTGEEIIFPALELTAELAARGIGLEVMSTAAACRTFNVLVSEERRVVAALLNGPF